MTEQSEKRITKKTRILALLEGQGRATQQQLNDISYRYGAILHTLRGEGHVIETVQIKIGHFNYIYKGKPTPYRKSGKSIYDVARDIRKEKEGEDEQASMAL